MSAYKTAMSSPAETIGNMEETFLPPFSNEENRALDYAIKELQVKLLAKSKTLLDYTNTISALNEHVSRAQREVTLATEKLVARSKQFSTDEHLYQLSLRNTDLLKRDLQQLQKQELEATTRFAALAGEKAKREQQLEAFSQVQAWNEHQLQQWATAAAQKEDDGITLQLYRRQDEASIKDLATQLERLTKAVLAKRVEVEEREAQGQALQTELDANLQELSRLHKEQKQLTAKSNEALESIQKREAGIEPANASLAAQRSHLAEKERQLQENLQLLQAEQAAAKQVEEEVLRTERDMDRQRKNLGAEQARLRTATDARDLLANTVAQSADELAQQVAGIEVVRKQIEDKQAQLEALKQKKDQADQKVETGASQNQTIADKLKALDQLCKERKAHLSRLEKEHQAAVGARFKQKQQLYSLQQACKELKSGIASRRFQKKNLADTLAQLETQAARQEEVLYRARYQLVMLEKKADQLAGARSEDELLALQATIGQQTQALEAAQADTLLVQGQVQKAEDDLGHARRRAAALQAEQARTDDAMLQLRVDGDTASRCVKALAREREASLVSHDVLELEVRRLRGLTLSRADDIAQAEVANEQARLELEDRLGQIQAFRQNLLLDLRIEREDARRVGLEVAQRSQRVATLGAKHSTLSLKKAAQGGEGDISQAAIVIRAAEELAELKERAAAESEVVAEAAREVLGLEQALEDTQRTNIDFSRSLKLLDFKQNETLRLEQAQDLQLREQLAEASDRLAALEGRRAELEGQATMSAANLEDLRGEEARLRTLAEELTGKQADAEKQSAEQHEKKDRAAQQVQRLQSLLKRASTTEAASVQADVQLALITETNNEVLQELAALAADCPDLAAQAHVAGLELPKVSVSRRSSTSSRVRRISSQALRRTNSADSSRASSAAGSRNACRTLTPVLVL